MAFPTYLSDADRSKLVRINQDLSSSTSDEDRVAMIAERSEIMGRVKTLPQCTIEELQNLRVQLYDQFQKHSSIGSPAVHSIARQLQQVEMREYLITSKAIDEPVSPENTNKKNVAKNPTGKPSTYSWTTNIDLTD